MPMWKTTTDLCVWCLFAGDGGDVKDRTKSAGVEVIGAAVVVTAEQHEALLHQTKPAANALRAREKNQALLCVHLVVHSSTRPGRLANLMTSLTRTPKVPVPAVVFVETGDAAKNGDERASDADQRSAIRHCNLVFYDAQVAAKGCLARCGRALSKNSAFHAPLMQVCCNTHSSLLQS